MRRRDFFAVLAGTAAAWPLSMRAQQRGKIPKIGVLWHAGSAEEEGSNFNALVKGFTDLGYVDGRNVILEHRFPNELPDRFTSMAAELVALDVDVLIGVGNNAAPYVKNATTRIPIVFVLVADPIETKLVDSLARPGGNATGLSNSVADLIGKRLELLKEVIPSLSRAAVLVNANAQVSGRYKEVTYAAAANLGLAVQAFEWRSLDDLRPAFDAMTKARMQALMTNPDGLAYTYRAAVAQMAIEYHLPLSGWSRETLFSGALMAYGADGNAICHRAADYVDKILKGIKPSEIPVEQPTKFELLVNLKAAKALGLTIPESFLLRANEVIE